MSSTTWIYAGVLLGGVFLGAVSQVMLKKAAMRECASKAQEYLNPLVITAYAIFFATTLLSVYAYKGIPLSMGPVLEATSYIYITVFGVCIFKEKLTAKKIAALLMIVGGILVYSLVG